METPRDYNITLPTETKQGRRIHVFDYREGYEKWCAVCDDVISDHTAANGYDHPPILRVAPSPPCPHCEKPVNPDYHFGVYFNRVAYAMFDSRLCAYEFDITTIEGD